MKMDKLRTFAAGLDVQQKDPASGSRRSKGQQLYVRDLTQRHGFAVTSRPHKFSFTPQLFGTFNAQLFHDNSLDAGAQAASSSRPASSIVDNLPDAEHLRAEAVVRGEDWKPHNSAMPQLCVDGLFISMVLRTFPT